jgi:hypothetical protein
VTALALAQLPRKLRRRVLVRADSGGGAHEFLHWLASPLLAAYLSAHRTMINGSALCAALAVTERD